MRNLFFIVMAASLACAANAANAAAGARLATPPAWLIPTYDATTLAKACADGLAHSAKLVDELAALPLDRVRSTDVLGKWDQLRIVLDEFFASFERKRPLFEWTLQSNAFCVSGYIR